MPAQLLLFLAVLATGCTVIARSSSNGAVPFAPAAFVVPTTSVRQQQQQPLRHSRWRSSRIATTTSQPLLFGASPSSSKTLPPLLQRQAVLHEHEEPPVDVARSDAIASVAAAAGTTSTSSAKSESKSSQDTTTTRKKNSKNNNNNSKTKYCIPLEQICLDDLPKVGGYVVPYSQSIRLQWSLLIDGGAKRTSFSHTVFLLHSFSNQHDNIIMFYLHATGKRRRWEK